MEDSQNTHDSPTAHKRYVRRVTTAVAGAAVLVALSFGVALAAGSDDGPTPAPSTEEVDTPSPWDPTSGTSGGVDGGTDPVPTQTSITEAPLPTGDPTSPTSEPEPDLAELNRRISQLDKKIDQLPKKKELADALRAFADELDKSE